MRHGSLELIGYLLIQSGLILVTVVIVVRGTIRSPTAIAYLLVVNLQNIVERNNTPTFKTS